MIAPATNRTLASPRQTFIPPVCGDWARAGSQSLFHVGRTWKTAHGDGPESTERANPDVHITGRQYADESAHRAVYTAPPSVVDVQLPYRSPNSATFAAAVTALVPDPVDGFWVRTALGFEGRLLS